MNNNKSNQLNIKSTYSDYKNFVTNPVSLQDYCELTAEYNKFLIEKVLMGECVTLPYRMGTLEIVGKKQKPSIDENGNIRGLAPDWVNTKKLWEKNSEAKKNKTLVYHSNLATDGLRFKYFWSKNRVLLTNKYLYSLVMTRDNKRKVFAKIKKGAEYKTVE